MTYKEFLQALSNAYDKLIQSEFGKTHAFMCYVLDGDYSFMSDDEIRINKYFQEETGLHLSQDDVHGYCDALRTEIRAIQNVSKHGWADTMAVQMGGFPLIERCNRRY